MVKPQAADVQSFLDDLETVQRDFARHFEAKHAALVAARIDDLNRLTQPESELTARLQALLKRRGALLEQSRLAGEAHGSLTELIPALGADADDRAELERRAASAAGAAQDLRRDSWMHWIIAQRAHAHFSNVLELIAHSGQTAPTYGPLCRTVSPGGAILDASA